MQVIVALRLQRFCGLGNHQMHSLQHRAHGGMPSSHSTADTWTVVQSRLSISESCRRVPVTLSASVLRCFGASVLHDNNHFPFEQPDRQCFATSRPSPLWHSTQHVNKPRLTNVMTLNLNAPCPCQNACKHLGYTCRGCTCALAHMPLTAALPFSPHNIKSHTLGNVIREDQCLSSFTKCALGLTSHLSSHPIPLHLFV